VQIEVVLKIFEQLVFLSCQHIDHLGERHVCLKVNSVALAIFNLVVTSSYLFLVLSLLAFPKYFLEPAPFLFLYFFLGHLLFHFKRVFFLVPIQKVCLILLLGFASPTSKEATLLLFLAIWNLRGACDVL
jgi:hypothetical protein